MDNAELVERYFQMLADRDRDGLLDLLAPDLTVIYHAQPDHFPWSGRFEGIDGFDRFLDAVARHLDVVRVERRTMIADATTVVVPAEGHWRVRATGRDVHGGMVSIFTIDHGRIRGYEVFADTAAFREALAGPVR